MSYILGKLLTFPPKCDILHLLHKSHNFHKECAFLFMVKMHTPFSAFSSESSEDLCSNNWRCVFRALQLGRTFFILRGEYMNNDDIPRKITDITGVELTPGEPAVCLGNGEQGFECCCDECDYFLLCFPEFDSKSETINKTEIPQTLL